MTPAGAGQRHETRGESHRTNLWVRRAWIARLSALALGCLLAVGAALPAGTQAQQPAQNQFVSLGTHVASLINAHDLDGLVALFTPADITCPGPDPAATGNVCQGRAPGTVVQGYWAGPLYSELGAVTSAGIRAEVSLGLDRVPAPVALATTARQAMFPFLREQCPDCGTVVLAGTPSPAGGQPTLSFSVKLTANGPRLFSVIRGDMLQPDEGVYVTGGTHRDGTEFVRAILPSPTASPSAYPTPSGTPWPAPGGLQLSQTAYATGPDGSIVPVEKRDALSTLSWSALPGFSGVYVVERARVAYGSPAQRQWEQVYRARALLFEDPYPLLDLIAFQRCYRVRTEVNGESGPASGEVCTPAPPNTGPTEPLFNYDIVREVVVPLIGDDGRTHYVTLSEDTAGVVRIRLSLFSFRPTTYNVVLFRRGDCSATADYGPDDVIFPNFPLTLDAQAATSLVLTFFNTDSITLTPGSKSIYDGDGTALTIYRPGSGGSGLRAACAVLAGSPRAPKTGNGSATPGASSLDWGDVAALAGAVALAGAAASMALRRWAVRP